MPALLVARGTAIAWRAVAAPPVITPAVGVDLRRWRLVTRGRRGVAWQRTVVGAAGTIFTATIPPLIRSIVAGSPTVVPTSGATASIPNLARSISYGAVSVVATYPPVGRPGSSRRIKMISGQSIGIAQPFSMAPGEQLDFELDFTDELLADLDTLQDATCSASNALSYHDLRIVGNTVYVWVTVATDAPINSVARLKLFATSSSFPTRIRCISIDFAIEYGGRQG